MRLIDADKVIDNINEWLDIVGYAVIGKGLSYYAELIGCIDESPTVEAEPVKYGHWNYKFTINGQSYRYCSECLEIIYDDTVSKNYCPHCGAKMD